MEISPRHRAALDYAAAGLPVFPCVRNGKEPACEHGYLDATIDPAIINGWWAEADYNVALCPEACGWAVIDLDLRKEKWNDASATFANALPDTYVVQTPSDGRHHYFAGSIPSRVNKLAPAVDTRGVGGYVLIPPSVINGKAYEVVHDRDPAPLPDFIRDAIAGQNSRHAAAVLQLDQRGNIDRAVRCLSDYVSRGDVGRDGDGSDDRTFRLACEILGLGISPEVCCDLLMEHWAPHCEPPFDRDWIESKVANAAEYRQNEIGEYGADNVVAAFGEIPAVQALLAESRDTPAKRSRFYPLDEAEQDGAPDPQWLIPNVMQVASTCLLVGPSRSYKSFLALDVGLAIASAVATFGVAPSANGAVIYAAAEGRIGLKKRRNAWKIARDIAAIPDFYVTPAPMIAIPSEVQEFGDEIRKRLKGRRCRLIILDTLSKVMAGLNENDARDANMLVKFCDSLVEAFGCSVLVIHHTGKDTERGARGSSAYFAGFDTVLEVKAHQKTKAVEVWCRKHKDAEEPERPWTFEGSQIAGSLVFSPTTSKEHRVLADEGDVLAGKKIGAALAKLGAYGQNKGVVSHVLARELTPAGEHDDPEEHEKQIGRTARSLSALSRSKLEAYVMRVGRDLLWFLPAPSAAT